MNNSEKEKLVKELYEKYPYPSRIDSTNEKLESFALWAAKSLKEDNSFWKGKTILELGCGTGELSVGLALCKAKVTAVDFSSASIKKARQLAEKKCKTNKPKYYLKNILDLKENEFKKKFDVVIALGSLHHTVNAKKGFEIGCAQLKENGIIIIGLYNKYSRAKHRVKRIIVRLIAGNDIEKRIKIGEIFYNQKTNKERIADKFGQVHESYHSINEILKWFKEQNIEFIGSKPEFEKPIIDELKWLIEKKNAFFVMSGKLTSKN
jgi:2-polyprenyl-3-methyl-5-hydroxy-6-metoxy-1,4-benzoquinol methylase